MNIWRVAMALFRRKPAAPPVTADDKAAKKRKAMDLHESLCGVQTDSERICAEITTGSIAVEQAGVTNGSEE